MGETKNYHLSLSDDATMPFRTWRDKLNGMTESNMIKIDAVLADKAAHSIDISAILLAGAWINASGQYTQEVTIACLTKEQDGVISVAHSATAAQRTAARSAILTLIGQENGKLIVAVDGKVPSVDIPVSLVLLD